MKVTCLLRGKFLKEKVVKNQGLVGLLQLLFQHNRFLVPHTPILPRIEKSIHLVAIGNLDCATLCLNMLTYHGSWALPKCASDVVFFKKIGQRLAEGDGNQF